MFLYGGNFLRRWLESDRLWLMSLMVAAARGDGRRIVGQWWGLVVAMFFNFRVFYFFFSFLVMDLIGKFCDWYRTTLIRTNRAR